MNPQWTSDLVYESPRTAETKYPKLSGLNNRNVLPDSSEAGRLRCGRPPGRLPLKAPGRLRASLLASRGLSCSLPLDGLFPEPSYRLPSIRVSGSRLPPFIRTQPCWIRAHPHDPIHWLHLQQPHFQMYSHSEALGF